jgi:GntR family transcriptional repressor for pyruvate dehydrogenase complex
MTQKPGFLPKNHPSPCKSSRGEAYFARATSKNLVSFHKWETPIKKLGQVNFRPSAIIVLHPGIDKPGKKRYTGTTSVPVINPGGAHVIPPTPQSKGQVLRPIDKKPLAQRIPDIIKAYVVNRQLKPGGPLPSERQLSEALGVSRNVVREGLSLLVAEGIIEKRHGSGIYLCEIGHERLYRDGERVLEESRAHYDAVREARAAVEIGAIGLIIHRITQDDLEQLEKATAALERKSERGEAFINEDMKFHLTLLRAAHNELILQWSPLVEEVMYAWAYQADLLNQKAASSSLAMNGAKRVAAEHRAILEAVQQRDVQAARRLLTEHFLIPEL